MPVMERVRNGVARIVEEGRDVDEKIAAFVKEEFRRALENAERLGETVNQTVEKTLEGVKAGLKQAGYKSEAAMEKAAEAIAAAGKDVSEKAVMAVRERADEARKALDTAVERSKGEMEKVGEGIKEAVATTQSTLRQRTEAEITRLRQIGMALQRYADDKARQLNETTRTALRRAAEESAAQVKSLREAAAQYRKEFLQHSRARVAAWLNELAKRLEPQGRE